MIKISYATYIALGKLERFNKKSKFLWRVREVIRRSILLKEKGKFTEQKLRNIFPQYSWRYDPFQPIRLTVIIKPEEYVVIQDILEEQSGHVWEMDKFLKLLIYKFIQEYDKKSVIEDRTKLNKFENIFKKYYENIMSCWKD